jgi:hypothetical protein
MAFKWVFEVGREGVKWIYLAHDVNQSGAVFNTVIKFLVP